RTSIETAAFYDRVVVQPVTVFLSQTLFETSFSSTEERDRALRNELQNRMAERGVFMEIVPAEELRGSDPESVIRAAEQRVARRAAETSFASIETALTQSYPTPTEREALEAAQKVNPNNLVNGIPDRLAQASTTKEYQVAAMAENSLDGQAE